MKKTLLFAILFTLFVGFSSCSSDEENDDLRADPKLKDLVLGAWYGGGAKVNEKYIFTDDFKCQKYERENELDPWVLSSENSYLINSTYIKIGNMEPIKYSFGNYGAEINLMLEENISYTYCRLHCDRMVI